MRILMLTSSYPKYQGETTAPFIEEIAAGVAACGHTVEVLAPWHPEVRRAPIERDVHLHFFRYAPHPALNVWGYAQSLLSDTEIKLRTLLALPFALGATMLALRKRLIYRCDHSAAVTRMRTHYDLIHAHWLLPNGVPAALLGLYFGLPLVISMHCSDVYLAERYWPLTLMAGLSLRAAAAVTACSSDLYLRGLRLGARSECSQVIPYGVNPHLFHPDRSARERVLADLRRRHNAALPDDTALVLGVGRLVSKKGFSVLLEAWPQVLTQHPQALLTLVGYGDLRPALEQQAQRLGIAERVCFTGQLDRSHTATYVAAADVFVLPIVRDQGADGLPNVLLEAMAAGRPIVASRVAGAPDVIDNERHGLLTPERNPAMLSAAIIRLLTERSFAFRLGAAARQRIEAELTWARTATKFEQIYMQALGNGGY